VFYFKHVSFYIGYRLVQHVIINIKNDKEQTDIEKELIADAVSQKKPKKPKPIVRRARPNLMDEQGNKLKKDGTFD
jgi:hypothetical protein